MCDNSSSLFSTGVEQGMRKNGKEVCRKEKRKVGQREGREWERRGKGKGYKNKGIVGNRKRHGKSSSSDNGADSIPSNIAPGVNKQMCIEKAVQQTMNSNFR